MASGKSDSASARFLALLYQAVGWPGVAIPDLAVPLIYYCLYQNYGPGVTQSASYPGYAPQAVSRSKEGHVLRGTIISPVSTVSFPRSALDGEQELKYFTTEDGAGEVFHFGLLLPPILVRKGVVPQLRPETTIRES